VRVLGWWMHNNSLSESGLSVCPCPIAPIDAEGLITRTLVEFCPDFVVTLSDVPWVPYMAENAIARCRAATNSKWIIHFPIDGTLTNGRLPPRWLNILRKADFRIAISQFGASAVMRSGLTCEFIPHGCDTALFAPPVNKLEAKRRFGWEQKFVVLADVRNHRRKLIPRLLDIMKRFSLAKEDITLKIHTNLDIFEDKDSYNYNILEDVAFLQISDMVDVGSKPGGVVSPSELANLYAAADVHLLTSLGEGFGLPTLQAASSGVVPLAGNHSANTELLGIHGIGIPSEGTAIDEFGIVRHFICRQRASRALETLYSNRQELIARSHTGRRFALRFSWNQVVTRWAEFLERSADGDGQQVFFAKCPPHSLVPFNGGCQQPP
jgi:glycosyltransferase involved in cell wall biosynthesis